MVQLAAVLEAAGKMLAFSDGRRRVVALLASTFLAVFRR